MLKIIELDSGRSRRFDVFAAVDFVELWLWFRGSKNFEATSKRGGEIVRLGVQPTPMMLEALLRRLGWIGPSYLAAS
jgi:hypothetical protein